jgi:hypothetical protein
VKSFTTKVDFTDTVLAEHVNSLQNEVTALQENLGTFIKTGSGWVGSFDLITTSWNTLKDRLANMEYGIKYVYDDNASSGVKYLSLWDKSSLEEKACFDLDYLLYINVIGNEEFKEVKNMLKRRIRDV